MKQVLFAVAMMMMAACGGSSPPPASGIGSPEPEPEASSWVEQCEACLAAGRSWTADLCSDDCYMDTWCYGAGNPAAPSCPEEPPPDSSDW